MQNSPNPAATATTEMMRPGDAAKMLGVTARTLSTMAGLHPVVLPSGHRRYRRDEVEALAATHPALAAENRQAVAS